MRRRSLRASQSHCQARERRIFEQNCDDQHRERSSVAGGMELERPCPGKLGNDGWATAGGRRYEHRGEEGHDALKDREQERQEPAE